MLVQAMYRSFVTIQNACVLEAGRQQTTKKNFTMMKNSAVALLISARWGAVRINRDSFLQLGKTVSPVKNHDK